MKKVRILGVGCPKCKMPAGSPVARSMSMPEESFLQIGPVTDYTLDREPGVFEARPCARCGEMAFVNKLRTVDGEDLCIACTNCGQ